MSQMCQNNQMSQMNQHQLLNYIDMVSFAVVEANLFLDTHPCSKEAMEYFDYYKKLRNEAMEDYARKYAPLTLDSVPSCSDKWKWLYSPWPWEGGNC